MAKEKRKTDDTPEELDMLFGKNRIYMLTFEQRTRKMYAYAYAAAASEYGGTRVEERLIELQLRKDIEECQEKGLDEKLKIMQGLYDMWFRTEKKDMCD
jgi:hypothetical protein